MEFRILERVEAADAGRPLEVGRRRERCLLGVLLLEAGTPVPVDRLDELLWDGKPPPAARTSLRAHVSRLRSSLGPGGASLLERTTDAYVARVQPEDADALRFRGMVERAGSLAEPARRAALLRRASGLWRGPLMADAASDRLRDRLGAPWAELRVAAQEQAIAAELACGRHRELVGELTALCTEHPYRELFAKLLMLALYRSGR